MENDILSKQHMGIESYRMCRVDAIGLLEWTMYLKWRYLNQSTKGPETQTWQ